MPVKYPNKAVTSILMYCGLMNDMVTKRCKSIMYNTAYSIIFEWENFHGLLAFCKSFPALECESLLSGYITANREF